ncbi:MAG TPA: glycoside hydrolase family 125 protein [Oligoflexus sp.]|uniref:glycoside hydrolase family 125 protein n=1 Tax=Oligoflexus sp. TaxID=1971216 RepID=UPI002D6BDC9F|nr:glycoside hydrolase family 125 protein [Oligoflexus sp.]HYX33924.1 glycoside hydrolase family 125 protein [Oligoflexus sp.]
MGSSHYSSRRPSAEVRCYSSPRIEEMIREISAFLPNRELAWLFENCFPNTLDTTLAFHQEHETPDTFIITGDIPAMWLRDSCAQIWSYLPFVHEDPTLDLLFQGAIHRQVQCIRLDPYANAFYSDQRPSPWQTDRTDMKPGVHERKWELDSLAYFLRLSHGYWQQTGSRQVFGDQWAEALGLCVQVITRQMQADRSAAYRFQRISDIATETLPLSGQGNPTRPCGLVASGFRPSDDACIFPYLIPSNAMTAVCLRNVSQMVQEWGLMELARDCRSLSDTIDVGIRQWGIGEHGQGLVFYYEVDGYGGRVFMDDANIPSLLSLPYLGYCPLDDPIYQNTRALLWSEANPYFFRSGSYAGIGGPHIGLGFIWPMSLMMWALTSSSEAEIRQALQVLMATHGGTGFMHESFHQDHPDRFTRSWFGWANSLFGELILHLYRTRPDLLKSV